MLAGGDKTTVLLASLLLFSSTYISGDVLPMLLRDPPFWAFTLTSLVYFIQFYNSHKLKDAILWQIFSLLGMLFRIEGATYLALLPFILLWQPSITLQAKIKYFIQAHAVNITLSILTGITLLTLGDLTIQSMGRLEELFSTWSAIQTNFNQTILTRVNILASNVLGEPLQSYAWFSLILSLISIALIKTVSVAGWLPLLLVGRYYNAIKNSMEKDIRFILSVVASLAFVNGLLIIFKVNILPSRYAIIFGFIMIIFAAFALSEALKAWQLKVYQWNKTTLVISAIIVGLSLISNLLPQKSGHNVEQKAVTYLKQKGVRNEQIFFVSPRARFYAEAPYVTRGYDYWEYTKQAIDDGSILNYQYLMIPLKTDATSANQAQYIKEKLPQYHIDKTFYGVKKKKNVVIYQRF